MKELAKNSYFPLKEELLNETKIKIEQEYDKNEKICSLRDKIINYYEKVKNINVRFNVHYL